MDIFTSALLLHVGRSADLDREITLPLHVAVTQLERTSAFEMTGLSKLEYSRAPIDV